MPPDRPRGDIGGRAAAAALAALLLCGCAGDVAPQGDRPPLTFVSLAATSPAADASVPVVSFRARRFLTTIRQRYDYSCGSAALATLLTHHYALPTGEQEVLADMLANGDQETIRRVGFSLLDMQRYLARRGLRSNGYRVPLERLTELGIPGIALIDNAGYRHFVVVRGLDAERVLVADPNLGTRTIPREQFVGMWNGVLFVLLDHVELARATFGRDEDWNIRPRMAAGEALALLEAGRPVLGFPQAGVF
jgi:predicted double-glycine peptidase